MALDRPCARSRLIHDYSRVGALKNHFDHVLIDPSLSYLWELYEQRHSDVSTNALDIVSRVIRPVSEIGSNYA